MCINTPVLPQRTHKAGVWSRNLPPSRWLSPESLQGRPHGPCCMSPTPMTFFARYINPCTSLSSCQSAAVTSCSHPAPERSAQTSKRRPFVCCWQLNSCILAFNIEPVIEVGHTYGMRPVCQILLVYHLGAPHMKSIASLMPCQMCCTMLQGQSHFKA